MSAEIPPIVGVSRAMKRANELVERFGPSSLPIMLVGATGTGKELFARHIHRVSRRNGTLVDVNCGAVPQEIAESLLFGHRKGAFTGAVDTVIGHVERADRGTLFLDEVLQLSLQAQVKLLRVVETGEVQPLGSGQKQRVDFRIVSAAQEDTPERLDHGQFRHDLFQRLAGVVIDLPLLVDRPEDIMPLAAHFAEQQCRILEPGADKVLEGYSWPGNVRELRLAIERAGCLASNGTLPPGALKDAIGLGMPTDRRAVKRRSGGRRKGDRQARISEDLKQQLAVYEAHGGDARRAAAELGISLSTFYARLKRAGMDVRAVRNGQN
jgi:two-component system, NtrC family, nitrogen regulation response regulator NtrX